MLSARSVAWVAFSSLGAIKARIRAFVRAWVCVIVCPLEVITINKTAVYFAHKCALVI
jgi:Fe-S-cluster-containing hydrogenase component 2